MSVRRLLLRLNNSYESVLKTLLLAKQGRLSLLKAEMRIDGGEVLVDMMLDGPAEKLNWFIQKALSSPYVIECRSLD